MYRTIRHSTLTLATAALLSVSLLGCGDAIDDQDEFEVEDLDEDELPLEVNDELPPADPNPDSSAEPAVPGPDGVEAPDSEIAVANCQQSCSTWVSQGCCGSAP